nr:T9SS sorting signal type C domain-containing protein [uncultured Flavobacterium sp.]
MNKALHSLNKRILLFLSFLLISTISFGQTTLFQFNFENGFAPNIDNVVGAPGIFQSGVNAAVSTINECGGNNSLSGSDWVTNDYYLFIVNTTGYENMTFSYCNSASSTNIGSFLVLVSPDLGVTTSEIIPSYTPATNNVTKTSITLPASANNNGEVWIAIYKDSNPTGNRTLYIDNATLIGCPIISAGTLSGNQYICSYGSKTTTFSSTITGGIWSSSNTSIANVNSTTGLVTSGVLAGSATITYTVGSGACTQIATRDVYVASGPGGGVTSIAGSNSQCQGTTTNYTITSSSANSGHTWAYSGSGVTFVTSVDGRSATATFSANSTSGRVTVNSTNACGSGYGNGLDVAVASSSNGGSIPSSANGCANTYITYLNLTGYLGNPIRWESSNDNFVSNIVSIANTNNGIDVTNLIQTTYYRAVVQNSPCTNIAYSNISTITINNSIGGTVSSAQTICSGNQPANLTLGGNAGSVVRWEKATDIGFTTGLVAISNTSTTLTGATIGSLTANTYLRAVVQNGSCIAVNSAAVLITVTTSPAKPTQGAIVHPDCVSATGSVTLNSLPSTGTWTLTRSGTSSATITGTGSSTTISGLAPGTYTFTVSNSTCTSLASDNVVINPVVTDTWNGTAWSTGLVPTNSQKIVFVGDFNQDIDLVGCSCIVTGSAAVTMKSNRTLTITNEVEVVGLGTLTFENRASLVQINDAAVNKGNIIYKRLTNKGVRNTDYTYWSTPVSPLNLEGTGGISYNPSNLVGSIFYSYEVTVGSEDWKSELATSPMIVGKGYSIRGPGPISVSPLTPLEATFTGRPNNGPYPITGIYPYKSYLLGNPYPSALDADKFLRDNAGVIDGTLYFWTHSTKIGIGVVNPGTGVYAYSGDDYASYNLTGGVGTVADSDPDKTPSNPNKPTGKIGAGQGFFATSNTTILGTNEIVFNNSMRVGVGGITGNNSQFFKTNSTKSKTTSTIEKNRLWLNLTNTQGAFKQLLVGYITGATNDHDNGYDGETFDGNEFLDFYSVNQEKNFVIQGRALPFDLNDEVSLGYRSVAAGDFSIGIDEVDGVMLSQKVYIEDKLLNVAHDLKASPYDFTTQAGTFNDRFVLRYVDKTLGTGDFETADDKIIISVKNKQIKIDSPNETIDKVLIFDLLGKEIYRKISIGKNEHTIANLSSSEQALIVKVVLQNGQTVSRKIIF